MSTIDLTEDAAIEFLQNFFREKPFLVFGTGMSCALDDRFGMVALKDTLTKKITEYSLTESQLSEWHRVEENLKSGMDLESALNAISNDNLTNVIITITGEFIASVDREYAYKISSGDKEWPATKFVKRLVDNLSGEDPILHALTPNYEMLFEYACDWAGISYTNGFFGGVQRKTDWSAVDRAMKMPDKVHQRKKMQPVYKNKKHVRLYKVHGSLNYFFHQNDVVENNAWMWFPPNDAQRVIITPGLSKHEQLQSYRRELLQTADSAIDNAKQFLFLGYGFNDIHIEEYINRKLEGQNCKGLIITRDCNPRIEALLKKSANLWIVCKMDDATNNGTKIFNNQYSDWLHLPDKKLWDISVFTSSVLEGE